MENSDLEIISLLNLSEHKSICTIFSFHDLKILFDCGWDESFSEEIAKIYRDKITFNIDHIFISNNSITYLGALPLLNSLGKLKNCQIHCTTPVSKLGFYILLDSLYAKIEQNDSLLNFLCEADLREPFLNICEVKYKENIEIKQKELEMAIYPVPSGDSLGGCAWKINYKLQSIIYAPQFYLENKFICDPFPYEELKNPNYLVTDSLFSNKLPLRKIAVENKFKKNLLSIIERNKHVFIPCDIVNKNLELIILIEKILDEFYLTRSKDEGGKGPLQYKVVLCGYSSSEIVESVKSLIEFMGSIISRQFYSYNENPFNLSYVLCVKDEKEFFDLRKNSQFKFIVLSSMESLNSGISYKILPKILEDPDFYIFVLMKCPKNSVLREIIKKYQSGDRAYDYTEIKRNPIIDLVDESNENEEKNNSENLNKDRTEESKVIDLNNSENCVEKSYNNNFRMLFGDINIKKKLYSKKEFPMFNYDMKKKITDYGMEISEKELKSIKSRLDENNNNFDTNFNTYLNPESTEINSTLELKVKIKRKDMFTKSKYEYTKKRIFIRSEENDSISKFTHYPLFATIDFISKQTIIDEINPKKLIIFLGVEKQALNESNFSSSNPLSDLSNIARNSKAFQQHSSSKNKKSNSVYLNYSNSKNILANEIDNNNNNDNIESNNNKFVLRFNKKILNVKFDSSILQKMSFSVVKDFGNVYDLKNSFLKIKTKRNDSDIKEISLVYQDDIYLDQERIKHHLLLDSEESDKEEFDLIYNKNNLKLSEIKKEISKLFNEDVIIFGDYLSNKNQDFKLFVKNGDITLEGNYNGAYLKIRKFIQDYMSSYNFSNDI